MSPREKSIELMRAIGGVGGALMLPPVVEYQWIRASESGGSDAMLPCLFLGVLLLWITPTSLMAKVLLAVVYLFLMVPALFVPGAGAMCGFHHACM
jgi:hypothetical protein